MKKKIVIFVLIATMIISSLIMFSKPVEADFDCATIPNTPPPAWCPE